MNFTVYKSSAGSGKTFTLVKEYLRIALSDASNPPKLYRQILAITFTNKAAAEMKDRVIAALEELAHPKENMLSPMASELTKELSLDAFTLAQRAQRTLRAILHNYNDFSISTIDSFVHRIVRTFAHDLHLPMNFEVELDAEKIIREAVDLLISRIGSDELLTHILLEFSESKADEEKGWQIERELRSIAKHLLTEEGSLHAQKLRHLAIADFLAARKKIISLTLSFEKEIQNIASSAIHIIKSNGLVIEDFFYGKNGIAGRLHALAEGKIELLGKENSNISKTISEGKWAAAKSSAASRQSVETLRPYLEEKWENLSTLKEKHFSKYILRKLILNNLYALAVLNEIEKIIFSFRSDQNVIHISEFNRVIADIVFKEPAPFIYERLGEKYTNYLIDEFQDTSGMQWQNLLPLVENALAGNNFTMLVGDGKQSIYRWRGGEVEQFALLPKVRNDENNELIAQRAQSLKRNYHEKHLFKNYRSAKEIVEFNNAFFGILAGRLSDDHQPIYDKLQQEYQEKKGNGYVRIEFPEEQEGKDVFLSRSLELVQELSSQGWNYNDIAILTRTKEEGSGIAGALLESGIPVLSAESLLLKNAPVVNFLVALLRCIEDDTDELAATEVLEFLVSEKKVPSPLHDCMQQLFSNEKGVEAWLQKNKFDFFISHLSRQPMYERCEELLRIFQLDQQPDSYILFFLDEILSWSSGRNPAKEDFFSWWADRSQKASVIVAEGMNAVNVMTIHKAKGLQFPVVILPYAMWKCKKQKDQFWIDPADEEIPQLSTVLVNANEKLLQTSFAKIYEDEINKSFLDMLNELYVAMTRPEQQLFVLTAAVEGETSSLKSVADVISFALRQMNFSADAKFFESGFHVIKKEKRIFPVICIRPQKTETHPWASRLRIRLHAHEHWDKNAKRDRGLLLHEVLAGIEISADIAHTLQLMIQQGKLEVSERAEMQRWVEKIVNHEQLRSCFAKNSIVHRETEILLPNGKRYRPDRVVESGNELILLDYKTGEQKEEHRMQVDRYAETLKEMGYKNITKKIIYTENAEVAEW